MKEYDAVQLFVYTLQQLDVSGNLKMSKVMPYSGVERQLAVGAHMSLSEAGRVQIEKQILRNNEVYAVKVNNRWYRLRAAE